MQLDAKALADATADIVTRHVAQATAPLLKRIEALEGRPAPERGEKGEPGQAGPIGRDGVGLAGALIDRSGVLVLTLTDGTTRELGMVVGKDGADGLPGEKGESGERGERGEKGEPGDQGGPGPAGEKGMDGKDGRDGLNGKDGRDGFSLEDFDCRVLDDDRTIEFSFASGATQHVAALKWPTMIYRGVFHEGRTYERGDTVTWGGELWHCERETDAKPVDGEDWRRAVRKGRDGKSAK